MASIETFRPDASGPAPQTAAQPDGGSLPEPATSPAAFQADQPGDNRLAGLLAFALAAERQEAADPETVARLKREAEAALCDHAFRYLHNNVEHLRREAVAEQLGHLPRPPGLLRLVAANLVALAIAGAAGGWLALHPQTLAGLTGLLTG
jgi:hypothetical protein